MDDNYSHLVLI